VARLQVLSGMNFAFGICRYGVAVARLQVLSGLKGALGDVDME
jgi:hypothetical protein